MFWVGAITAGMTAFYVFRAMFVTFFGQYRGTAHPHESPAFHDRAAAAFWRCFPMGGGFIVIPKYLDGMFPHRRRQGKHDADGGFRIGRRDRNRYRRLAVFAWHACPAAEGGGLYQLVYNKYYVDEVYDAAVVRPVICRLPHGVVALGG